MYMSFLIVTAKIEIYVSCIYIIVILYCCVVEVDIELKYQKVYTFVVMMRRYEINPIYKTCKELIDGIPSRFEREGEVLYQWRNCIKKIIVEDGMVWNVKSFKIPYFLNRFVYRYFRKSKAERSYINAMRLLQYGVDTPTPVAYIIEQNAWGISHSYYISEQLSYDCDLHALLDEHPADFEELLRGYARFVYSFHRKGIYFLDLSVGNTLIVRKPEGGARYYLVDLNRTWFYGRPLTCLEGVKGFCRIDTPWENKDFILHEYAKAGGYEYAEVLRNYKKCERRDDLRRALKDRGIAAFLRMFLFGGNS